MEITDHTWEIEEFEGRITRRMREELRAKGAKKRDLKVKLKSGNFSLRAKAVKD